MEHTVRPRSEIKDTGKNASQPAKTRAMIGEIIISAIPTSNRFKMDGMEVETLAKGLGLPRKAPRAISKTTRLRVLLKFPWPK